MKLSRILRLAYCAQKVDEFLVDKVYPTDALSRYNAVQVVQEVVGETPGDPLPATLGDVPAFCDHWITFLYGALAPDLGAPATITRPLLRGLYEAVQQMRDRPVLPDGLRRPPQVRHSNLGAVAEVLRAYRDWSKPPLLPAPGGAPVATAPAVPPPPPPPPPSPPPRLTVDLPRKAVTLDGVSYDVASDNTLRWVRVLAEHPGEWISGSQLSTHDSGLLYPRPDRFRKHLPGEVLALIDSTPGKGSRIRL